MRMVLDNNLPQSLARLCRGRGMDAVHVVDLGLSAATDDALRERFAQEEIVLISRDHEFWNHHPAQWGVVWVALHNPTLSQLKGPIFGILAEILPGLRAGQRVFVAADQVRVFEEP